VNAIENISAADLADKLAAGESLLLVDVRGMPETAQGVIAGAHLLPLHLVPMNVDKLRGHDRVVLYCHSGARSAQACYFLAAQGVSGLMNLDGGVMSWVVTGNRLAPADTATSLV